jgi:prepilin-type N-terminal cleavage/methylation domain-containing protein
MPGAGFTLVELLVAMALLVLLSVFLVGISGQAGRMWSWGESRNQHRQKARAALDFMARDLRLAYLGVDPASSRFQFVINPPIPPSYHNRDSIFWLARVATDAPGGVAEVGYFVRWQDGRAALCRFFVNPSDPNYLIYQVNEAGEPVDWINKDGLLDVIAPGTRAGNYRGLFLENVIGMWIDAYRADGSLYEGDSKIAGNKLPSRVEISLALLDESGAARLQEMALAPNVQSAVQSANSAADLLANLPPVIRPSASMANLTVYLDCSP